MTPWQKAVKAFGLKPAALAREIKRDRAKLSRALKDPEGLINGEDQKLLMEAAVRLNVTLRPADLLPEVPAKQP